MKKGIDTMLQCEAAGCTMPAHFEYTTTQGGTDEVIRGFCSVAHVPSFLYMSSHLFLQPEFQELRYTLGNFSVRVCKKVEEGLTCDKCKTVFQEDDYRYI